MRRFGTLALVLTACAYSPQRVGIGDDGGVDGGNTNGDDAPIGPRDIPHLPTSQEMAGTGALTLADNTMIDTGQLAILGSNVPAGVEIVASVQEPAGPEVALIRADTVVLAAGARVRAFGPRPLVILANRITIEGTLDGGGRAGEPGPGGGAFLTVSPGLQGNGGNGVHTSSFNDGGGGGGGHRTSGAIGGLGSASSSCQPVAAAGAPGTMIGTDAIDVLRGGGAGGQGSATACPKLLPGAGGGAIQLSALSSITIGANAAINVGGGGGGGGDNCGGTDTGAGSGGGAGGALFVDAPQIVRDGALGANGGGGGGGASSPGTDGTGGGNATASSSAATGGPGGGGFGARGGDGATGAIAAEAGSDDDCDGNGGGGGGGLGTIVLHVAATSAISGNGFASPTALVILFP